MCTLTIIPQQEGFLLTSNRDEGKNRMPANFPVYQDILGSKVLFPQDGDAHGSWVAMNDYRVISLLNGAYEKYDFHANYRKSRGIVLLDSFKYKNFIGFSTNYDFKGIAPFTLICLEHIPQLSLQVLRWDGEKTHYEKLDATQTHIFSSAPLYPIAIREKRKELFADFIQTKATYEDFKVEDLVDFHQFGGDDNTPIRLDDTNFVRTVSITSIQKKNDELQMEYHDLGTGKVKREVYI